jgi:hypothetical protein
MNYSELKKVGTKISETDLIAYGYSGTKEYWEYNNNIYLRENHTNSMTYTGKNSTDNIATIYDFGKYEAGFYFMNEEEYDQILEYCKNKIISMEVIKK